MAHSMDMFALPPLHAHGLAVSTEDVPLPIGVFYLAAVGVLVLSFVLLAGLWSRERWSRDAIAARGGITKAPAVFDRISRSRAWRRTLALLGVSWLALVLMTALFGSSEASENPAPNLVFVAGWIGLALLAVTLGRGALFAHPIGALARAAGFDERANGGAEPEPGAAPSAARPLPPSVGVWPAFVGLSAFVWLELVYPTAADVRLLGGIALVWAVATTAACSRWGTATWLERGDPFGTYAVLLGALAPWERRGDGALGWRAPFSGAARDVTQRPGLVPLVILLIGSVSYDGLSRTGWWSARVARAVGRLGERGMDDEAARILFGTFGLTMLVLIAWVAYELAASASARLGRLRCARGGTGRAAQAFVASLLPIALAYVVAHYFAFFLVQVQDLPRLLADPFARGWNPGGLADRTVLDYWRPAGGLVWVVQVGAIIVGHVVGLLLAHDRALELAPRGTDGSAHRWRIAASQLPMLALMLLYTVGGLYFLSEGLT